MPKKTDPAPLSHRDRQGWRKPLEFEDLYDIPTDLKTDAAFERFGSEWDAAVAAAGAGGDHGALRLAAGRRGEDGMMLATVFLRTHWLRLTAVVGVQLLYTASTFGGPLLLNQITKFLELPASEQQVPSRPVPQRHAVGMEGFVDVGRGWGVRARAGIPWACPVSVAGPWTVLSPAAPPVPLACTCC